MDIIAKAQAKRRELLDELQRIEQWLKIAEELEESPQKSQPSFISKAEPSKGRRPSQGKPRSGIGVRTAKVVEDILADRGEPLPTRALVEPVQGLGIEISGRDPVATLSARLGNNAKRHGGRIVMRDGKWHLDEWLEEIGVEEAAGRPGKDEPTASMFNDQEGGETNAAPLV